MDERLKENLSFYEEVCASVEAASERVGHEANASFLDLKRRWGGLPKVPIQYFEVLEKRYKLACDDFLVAYERFKEDEATLAARRRDLEACCRTMEAMLAEKKFEGTGETLKKLQRKWSGLTDGLRGVEDYDRRFSAALAAFRDERDRHLNERHARVAAEAATLDSLKAELEGYSRESDLRPRSGRVKEINTLFHDLRRVQFPENRAVATSLERLLRECQSRLKKRFLERDWQRWENYTYKLTLCEKAEKLLEREDLFKVSGELKELRGRWKKIGAAPREKSEEVWRRFDDACNAVFEKCKAFFQQVEKRRMENGREKARLCERVEAVKDSTEWRVTAEMIKEAQTLWKSIGSAPKSDERALNDRFRKACDDFFTRRRGHFEEIKQVQNQNKERKSALCEEAESLSDLECKVAFDKIDEIRREWRRCGAARHRDEQTLWKRFNAAIDAFHQRVDESRHANLREKERLLDELRRCLDEATGDDADFAALSSRVGDLERQWRAIGPVPRREESETQASLVKLVGAFRRAEQSRAEKDRSEDRRRLTEIEVALGELERLAARGEAWERIQREFRGLKEKFSVEVVASEQRRADLVRRLRLMESAIEKEDVKIFERLKGERTENLRKKINVCVRLEKLVGFDGGDENVFATRSAASLAEELKSSIESNFSAKKRLNGRPALAELAKLESEWMGIGPVPLDEMDPIQSRFQRVLDAGRAKRF